MHGLNQSLRDATAKIVNVKITNMSPQGIAHKISETEWRIELQDGSELPLLPSDVVTYYQEMRTCGKPICGCWILKEGLRLEYQVVDVDGVSFASII